MVKDENRIIVTGSYDGTNTNKSGVTTLKFRFPYSEIVGYIKTVQLIGIDTKVVAKVEDQKYNIGIVRVKQLKIDREGEAQLHFEGSDIEVVNCGEMIDKNIKLCMTPIGG